ncbi:peptidylprolyl isomerase [Pelagibius sp. CAU 1746]|uniref:peptidylprolyl isomerase n=1 Tax=Pelagibius sp. CAU 1746 TaxID=3140370 RepID=UPI00325B4714
MPLTMMQRPFQVARRGALFAACLLLLATSWPVERAHAQSDLFRPAAVVNDDIISVLDLAMRLQLVIIAAGVEDTQEVRRRLTPQVLRGLIDERLQMQEAKRLDISVPDVQVAGALEQIAQQNKMTEGQFLTMLRNRGVIPTTLIDQIRAQIAWRSVILRRIRPNVVVSNEEIEEVANRLAARRGSIERRVAEIFVPIETAAKEAEAMNNANRLLEELRRGANFAGLARQFSQSGTASLGGDLGWVRDGELEEPLNTALARMGPGEIAGPVRTISGFHILLLRDMRKNEGQNIDRTRIEENLANQRTDQLAQRSLQELRRLANVDVRI